MDVVVRGRQDRRSLVRPDDTPLRERPGLVAIESARLPARLGLGGPTRGVKAGNRPSGGSVTSDVRWLDSPLGTGVLSQIALS